MDRRYYNTPGYYYLHRAIPFYDAHTGQAVNQDLATVSASVSHLVSEVPDLAVPGYSFERAFGSVRILRRDAGQPPVRRWREYAPVIADELVHGIMRRVDRNAPAPPPNAGIRFAAGRRPERRARAVMNTPATGHRTRPGRR